MATNTFKNAVFRNIGVSEQVIYTPPSGKDSLALQLDIANTSGVPITASAYIKRSGTTYYIIKNGDIDVGESLQVIYGQKIVIKDGDSICVTSSLATSVDVVCSILEDVNP